MKCRSCGREVPDGTGVCPSCGTAAGSETTKKDRLLPPNPEPVDPETLPPPAVVRVTGPPPAGRRAAAERSPAAARFPPGAVLAERYRVVHLLGRGGMGEVYRADDLKLGVPVALKFLPAAVGRQQSALPLLLEEVKIARRIHHPNACRVYDVGEAEGLNFISMEYIDGENLASLRRRIGRLPVKRAIEIGLELCDGLAAIHRAGILHQDLKPSNLMIDGDGRARITDFGLARLAAPQADRRLVGGTPAYMAPEQLAGREVSVKSDLYTLGLVLYELVTGRRAFAVASPDDLRRLQHDDRPLPPAELVDGLDPAVERVILRCLKAAPEDRPASAAAVATELEQAATVGWRPAPGRAVPHRPHWVIDKKLSEGGFGEVWLAAHRKTGEQRVFKFCYEAAKLHALKREITLFRLLKEELGDRDDIVRIFDWSFDEPPFFIESEYTEGGNLLEWAAEQGGLAAVPLDVRLEIVAQVATALSAAHSVGVLHKDVKPANVLITRDQRPGDARDGGPGDGEARGGVRASLTDFGVGALVEGERLAEVGITPMGLTDAPSGAGTQLYMAPELLEGKPATLQADVYALAVLLYQMVVGDFTSALAQGWQRQVRDELLREEIAAAVDGAPERRLGDARRLAERLRSLERRRAERQAERRRQRETERAQAALARSRRRRKLVAAVIAVLAVAAAGLGLQARRSLREAARARDMARVAVAGEWLTRDPTRAALVLLEVAEPEATPFALAKIRAALASKLAARELRGHRHFVWTAAFSPDGEHVVTASQDGTARVWRVDAPNRDGTGAPVVLAGGGEPLVSAAFSPDGGRVVAAFQDGTARVWPIGTNRDGAGTPVVLAGHEGPLRSAAFSPDGARVVTASEDGTARVWPAVGGAPVVLAGHEHGCLAASFDPRGARVLTVSFDGMVRAWRIEEPRAAVVRAGGDGLVRAASFAGGRLAVVAFDGTARAWRIEQTAAGDVALRDVVLGEAGGAVFSASFSPGGERVVTISGDSTVRVWRVGPNGAAGAPVVLAGHDGPVFSASFSPDGERVVTASGDHSARIWNLGDAAAGEPVMLAGPGGAVVAASFSADGERVATLSANGTVRTWNVGARRGPQAPPLAFAGDGRLARAGSFSPDGGRVVVVSGDYTAQVRALAAPPGKGVAIAGQGIWAAAFSPDGRRLVAASVDGSARIWDLGRGGEPIVLAGHDGPVFAAAFSPDGERLVTASGDRTARIWPAAGTGEPLVLEHDSAVLAAAFSPDGGRLVTASGDGTARLWHLDDGPPARRTARAAVVLEGHGNGLWAAAFSPDGERVVTASEDGTARLWHVGAPNRGAPNRGAPNRGAPSRAASSPDGPAEPVVLRHDGPVFAAAFSPDGERLVTASGDGTARVWRLDPSELVAVLGAATQVCLDPEFRAQHLGEPPAEARRRYEACERSRAAR